MNKDYKSKFLKKLIKYVSKKKLRCFYLGNFFNINDKSNSDIDLYINFRTNSELLLIIINFSKIFGYKICNIIQYEINSFYIIFSLRNRSVINFISIDVCNNYFFKNRLLLDFKKEIKSENDKYSNNKINQISNLLSFKYYFLKKIMKNDINETSLKFLKKIYLSENKKIDLFLLSIYNFKEKNNIVKNIKKLNYFFFKKKSFLLKKKIISTHKIGFFNYIKQIKLIVFRSLNPTGLDIGLLGVDGSGKTTILKKISYDFTHNKDGFCFIFRNLKTFHLSFLKLKSANKKTRNPHKKKEYNILLSLIKLIYLTIKELIEIFYYRFLKIKSHILLFDRIFMDISIDPKRYRIKDNRFVLFLFRFFGKLFLKEINFIIMDNKDTIYKRSKELNKAVLKKLLAKYNSIQFIDKSLFVILNKKNLLQKTLFEIKLHIVNHQHKKMLKYIVKYI